jgi:hypothetical protein
MQPHPPTCPARTRAGFRAKNPDGDDYPPQPNSKKIGPVTPGQQRPYTKAKKNRTKSS